MPLAPTGLRNQTTGRKRSVRRRRNQTIGQRRIVRLRRSRAIGRKQIVRQQRSQAIERNRIVRRRRSQTTGPKRTVRRQRSQAIGRKLVVRRPPGMSLLSGRRLLHRASVRSPSAVLLLLRKRVRRLNHRASNLRRGHRNRSNSRNSLSGTRSRRSKGWGRLASNRKNANFSSNLGGISGDTTLTV